MKKILLLSKVLILLLAVSTVAIGQYTGTYPNIATGSMVVASDSLAGFEPGNAVDGSQATYASIPGGAPAWIQIDLRKAYNIDGFGMTLPNDTQVPRGYIFQTSVDGATWTDRFTGTATKDSTYNYDVFASDAIKHVRIYMTSKDALASFTEIYVYGEEEVIPAAPVSLPATNVTATSFTANWSATPNANGYVYQVATDPLFLNGVPGHENEWADDALLWDITDLDPGTIYYYKARAYNLAGTSNFGNVITVTTAVGTQTITFDPLAASVYGDIDFDLTATASSGLPVSYTSSDETVATISGATVTIIGVGTTSITAMQAGDAQYLPATPVAMDLVVNKKELTVTDAVAADKAYDASPDAVISGATLSGVVGTDDVSLADETVGVFAQSAAGADIAVSTLMNLSGADTANYFLTQPVGLMAAISPKELMVIADDKTREECASNPDFTITYSGFVGAEDESIVDPKPEATSIADAGSADGDYAITVSGGSAPNYQLTYVAGTLTVTPDATKPVLVVKNATVQLDQSNNGFITPADVVESASDNCTLADTTLSQFVFTDSDVGDVNVDVTLTDAQGNSTTETAVVTVVAATGIADMNGLEARVYPNPTYGMVQLDLNSYADELKVMDITGKTILRMVNPGKEEVIDLTGYNSGIYIINLKFGNDMKHFKVVKK